MTVCHASAVRAADAPVKLDVESLRVFREVVASDGFTAAGERLGITQSAVSHKIRRLEERIGMDLMRREGQSVILTADGRDLLAHADEIIDAHDKAVDYFQRSELTGTVRLGCNEEVAATQLADVASRFRRTHPDVSLEIRVQDSAYVADWLDGDEIDIALIQVLDVNDAVRSTDEVWRRDELQVVQGTIADFDNVETVPLISFGPRCLYEPWLTTELDASGRAHRHAMECPSIQGVQAAVEAGLGVAVLNTPNLTETMRPWAGLGSLELPAVAFVLRTAVSQASSELIDALRHHLSASLSTQRAHV
ncbi:MAG: LysR family transcriptional regulator [Acidimicrobiales bacterium]